MNSAIYQVPQCCSLSAAPHCAARRAYCSPSRRGTVPGTVPDLPGDGDRDAPPSPSPVCPESGGRARNPRWEPGMGMIPDPRQIGDGGGDGPPIPGKSGMAVGTRMDPRSPANRGSGMGMIPDSVCRRVPSSCTLWVAEFMSPRLASVAVITRGRRVRRRHNDIRLRFRMLMLSAGLILQCQLT